MPRKSKKQKEAEEAARKEQERLETLRRQKNLRLTLIGSFVVMALFLAYGFGCFDGIMAKVFASSTSEAAPNKELTVADELGIEKPDLLTFDMTPKKELERKKEQLAKDEHYEKYGVYSCIKCCNKHDYCKYCKKPMKSWSSHRPQWSRRR